MPAHPSWRPGWSEPIGNNPEALLDSTSRAETPEASFIFVFGGGVQPPFPSLTLCRMRPSPCGRSGEEPFNCPWNDGVSLQDLLLQPFVGNPDTLVLPCWWAVARGFKAPCETCITPPSFLAGCPTVEAGNSGRNVYLRELNVPLLCTGWGFCNQLTQFHFRDLHIHLIMQWFHWTWGLSKAPNCSLLLWHQIPVRMGHLENNTWDWAIKSN